MRFRRALRRTTTWGSSTTATVARRIRGRSACVQGDVDPSQPPPRLALVPRWPEMGTRYDAPTGAGAADAHDAAPKENIDIWKALDEGRDPTA